MPSSEEDRDRRAEERGRRREDAAAQGTTAAGERTGDSPEDGDAQANGAQSGAEEDGSTLRTGATLAAAGALLGAAVGAASAVRSRRSGNGADTERALDPGPEALQETEADADRPDVAGHDGEEPRAGVESAQPPEDGRDDVDADSGAGVAAGGSEAQQPTNGEDLATPDAAADGGSERGEKAAAETSGAEPEPGSAAAVVGRARDQLSELTGRESEGVLGLERTENGWRVQVEVVELRRIPATTDVLGVYDVEIDDDGTVQHYRRTNRYVRSQAGGEG